MESGFVGQLLRRGAACARGPLLRATLLYLLLAVVVAWHALVGEGTLGPDAQLDQDKLYLGQSDPFPKSADLTPILLDQPRDLLFTHGLHSGRVDTWNPLGSCGSPLWAEQGGPFPLKLPYYLWPTSRTYGWFRALKLVV